MSKGSKSNAVKKECSNCKKVKPLSEFYKNKAMSDGKSRQCKKCHNEAVKKHRNKRRVFNEKERFNKIAKERAGKNQCVICGNTITPGEQLINQKNNKMPFCKLCGYKSIIKMQGYSKRFLQKIQNAQNAQNAQNKKNSKTGKSDPNLDSVEQDVLEKFGPF